MNNENKIIAAQSDKETTGNEENAENLSMEEIAIKLGVSEEEVQQAIENTGSDYSRIREFITRNHSETDTTNDGDNHLRSTECWSSEA